MWVYENLGTCLGGLFAAGIADHLVRRWLHRRRYRVLREAYEDAVRQVQATDCAPAAVVRCTELERDFMRAWWLPWSFGLGRLIRKMVMLCAGLTLLALALKGPLERAERRQASAASKSSLVTKATGTRPRR
jgi:hypothetical protein